MRVNKNSHLILIMRVIFNNFNCEFRIQQTKEERNQLLKDVINCIEKICIHKKINFNLMTIDKNNCAYFNYKYHTCFINDNGGEYNFDKCNMNNYMSVSYNRTDGDIEPIELALQILQGLEGQEINYNRLVKDQIKIFKKVYEI